MQQRKVALEKQLREKYERLQLNESKYILGEIGEKHYEINKEKLRKDKEDILIECNNTKTSIESIHIQIETIRNNRNLSRNDVRQIVDSVWAITDFNEKKKLIHQFIKVIKVRYLKDRCKDKVITIEYHDGIVENYVHKGYTLKVNQVLLTNEHNFVIIDESSKFKYEYEEVHLTQAHYVERLRAKRNNITE